MNISEVTPDKVWRKNACYDYEKKAAKTFCISKSSRRNSVSSDVKNNSFHKSSSTSAPVIKIMLKCVLELADKELKPQIKAESLSIINRILGSVPSVLQRQIMRNILLHMGLEDILPSLSFYKCSRLNDELIKFEKGQHLEESIQLSKSGKHPLNIFSEAYMKLAKDKNYLTAFMEFIEKIASGLDITKDDILILFSFLPSKNEKEEFSKGNECFIKDSLNNSIINNKQNIKNEGNVEAFRKLMENNNNSCSGFSRGRAISISSELPTKFSEKVLLIKKKTIDVEIQTEVYQQLPLNDFVEISKDTNSQVIKNNNKPPEAPPLPNFLKSSNSTKKVSQSNITNEQKVVKPSNNNLGPPPPPPPPLPMKNNKQNSKDNQQNNLLIKENNQCLENVSKYDKTKTTNTVSWTPVKNIDSGNKTSIWSNFVEPEFKETERNKIELVFEKPQKISRRLTIATFGKRAKENGNSGGNNNRSLTKGLSEKRALNLGIVLSRFKLKGVILAEALDSEQRSTFDIDLLSNLLLQYPTEEERKYFLGIGELSTLNSTEAFVWSVARKPHLKIKLELLVFEANFNVDTKNYIKTGENCLDVCKMLYQNPSIDNFFYKCLQIGNFLNQGSYNGTVTNKSSTIRIIDLLVESETFNTKEIYQLYDKLESIKSFDLNDFETMSNKIHQQLISIKTKIEAAESFLTTEEISSIFENYITICCKLKQLITEIKSLENDLQSYYCADKLKLEEIISIFLQAFDLFKKANMVFERNKIQSERYSKTIQSFGKPLSKLRKRIVKVDF